MGCVRLATGRDAPQTLGCFSSQRRAPPLDRPLEHQLAIRRSTAGSCGAPLERRSSSHQPGAERKAAVHREMKLRRRLVSGRAQSGPTVRSGLTVEVVLGDERAGLWLIQKEASIGRGPKRSDAVERQSLELHACIGAPPEREAGEARDPPSKRPGCVPWTLACRRGPGAVGSTSNPNGGGCGRARRRSDERRLAVQPATTRNTVWPRRSRQHIVPPAVARTRPAPQLSGSDVGRKGRLARGLQPAGLGCARRGPPGGRRAESLSRSCKIASWPFQCHPARLPRPSSPGSGIRRGASRQQDRMKMFTWTYRRPTRCPWPSSAS